LIDSSSPPPGENAMEREVVERQKNKNKKSETRKRKEREDIEVEGKESHKTG
jgi:hypothetical protein